MTFDFIGKANAAFAIDDEDLRLARVKETLMEAYLEGRRIGLAAGLQRAAEIARVMDTTAWACDAAVEIDREAETKGRD